MTHDQTISNMTHTINTLAEKLAAAERENAELRKELAEITSLFEQADAVVVGLRKELDNAFNPPFVNKAQEPSQ